MTMLFEGAPVTINGKEYTVKAFVEEPPSIALEPIVPELPTGIGAQIQDTQGYWIGLVRIANAYADRPSWVFLGAGMLLTEDEAKARVQEWGGFKVVFDGARAV